MKGKFPFFYEVNNEANEFDDAAILKAFRKVSFFYDAPVKNTIGLKTIATMRENGWKYLTPNVYSEQDLRQVVSSYYRSKG